MSMLDDKKSVIKERFPSPGSSNDLASLLIVFPDLNHVDKDTFLLSVLPGVKCWVSSYLTSLVTC